MSNFVDMGAEIVYNVVVTKERLGTQTMLYWTIWLTTSVACVLFLCLAAVMQAMGLRKSVLTEPFAKRVGRLSLLVLCVAGAAFVLCLAIDGFVFRRGNDFELDAQSFEFGPLYIAVAIAAVGMVVGALVLWLCFPKVNSVSPGDASAVKTRDVMAVAQMVFLLLGVICASVILSLLLDYVLLRKFNYGTAKRLVLAGVMCEVLVAVIVAAVQWRWVWRRRRAVTAVASTVLFALTTVLYAVLVYCDRNTVESTFFGGGSVAFVMLPILFTIALIFRRRLFGKNRDVFAND